MRKIASALLSAFFTIGGNRRYAQLGSVRERPPRAIQHLLRERASERRSRRQDKRLAWKCEYDATYYRASQLPGWTALDFRWSEVIDKCHEWAQRNEERVPLEVFERLK